MKYLILLILISGCATLQDDERLMRVAEKSYYYGCIYGADPISYKYLECHQQLKMFSHEIRKSYPQSETLEYAEKYNIKPRKENE